MFLRGFAALGLIVMGNAIAQIKPAPEHQWLDDVVGSHSLQVGVDSWRIHTSEPEDTANNMRGVSRLKLANSYPVWHYRDTSPWAHFEGGLRVNRDVLLTLKYRADQSIGARVDEASLDWAFHAYGLRFGVLDPKISWCRSYDVDSPWVREDNAFCSVQRLNFAKSSAPGGQAYANFILGNYSLQGVGGLYRPLWFNYAKDETPAIYLPGPFTVTTRVKTGMAVSATNLRNGTEFRMGWLKDRFSAKDGVAANVHSKVLFIGANWYATEKLALRSTYFKFSGDVDVLDQAGRELGNTNYKVVHLEINYQKDAKNVFAISRGSDGYVYDTNFEDLNFVTISTSASWRHDWNRGMFTVLQFTHAKVNQTDFISENRHSSAGRALGLRLGYRF